MNDWLLLSSSPTMSRLMLQSVFSISALFAFTHGPVPENSGPMMKRMVRFGRGSRPSSMSVLSVRAVSTSVAQPEMSSLPPIFTKPSNRCAEKMISPADGSVPGMAHTRSCSVVGRGSPPSTLASTVIFWLAISRRLRYSPSRGGIWNAKVPGFSGVAGAPLPRPAAASAAAADAGPADLERVEVGARALDRDDARRAHASARRSRWTAPADPSVTTILPARFLSLRSSGRPRPTQTSSPLASPVTLPVASIAAMSRYDASFCRMGVTSHSSPFTASQDVAARVLGEFDVLEPVFLQPVLVEADLVEQVGEFGGRAVLVVAARLHDHLPRVLAGRFADDLAHLGLRQQRPLQPGRHLRPRRDAQRQHRETGNQYKFLHEPSSGPGHLERTDRPRVGSESIHRGRREYLPRRSPTGQPRRSPRATERMQIHTGGFDRVAPRQRRRRAAERRGGRMSPAIGDAGSCARPLPGPPGPSGRPRSKRSHTLR